MDDDSDLKLQDPEGTAGDAARRVWPFLCLSTVASWAVWLWPVEQGRCIHVAVLGLTIEWPLPNLMGIIGVCLPGIIALIWALVQGTGEFRELLATLTRWRTHLTWYALAVGFPSGLFVASLGVLLLFVPTKLSWPPLSGFLHVVDLPLGLMWEEIAWRAFALRRLESRRSRPASALILGLYWAAWHVPIWLTTVTWAGDLAVVVLLIAAINTVALSLIFAFLYHRSGQSLPAVILLHFMTNTITGQMPAVLHDHHILLLGISMTLCVCMAVLIARRGKWEDG